MKFLEKVKTEAILGSTALMMLPTKVYATQDGGYTDTMNQLSPIFDRLKRPLSIALNAGFIVMGVAFGISALVDFLKSGQADNPNMEKDLKKGAIKKAIFAAVSVVGVLILNIIFSILGINWQFAQ